MATFRFYSALNDFLTKRQQHVPFTRTISGWVSVKDVIESLGVQHPEIGLVVANSESVDFTYLVQDTDHISAYPAFRELDVSAVSRVQPKPLTEYRFVLDVHLGTLATYLRMFGFDTLYRNDYADDELARISHTENRVLLTRDRGLLMRSIVEHGYYVRNTDQQLPPRVRDGQERFWHCSDCGRVYWERTHHQRMQQFVAKVQNALPM